jgi:hypothetical protein
VGRCAEPTPHICREGLAKRICPRRQRSRSEYWVQGAGVTPALGGLGRLLRRRGCFLGAIAVVHVRRIETDSEGLVDNNPA